MGHHHLQGAMSRSPNLDRKENHTAHEYSLSMCILVVDVYIIYINTMSCNRGLLLKPVYIYMCTCTSHISYHEVREAILEPFGLHDLDSYMAMDKASVEEIKHLGAVAEDLYALRSSF